MRSRGRRLARLWKASVWMLGLLAVAAAAAMAVGLGLPMAVGTGSRDLGSWWACPCLAVMGVWQLMVLSRMMPWSEPGRGLRLYEPQQTLLSKDRDSGNDDP